MIKGRKVINWKDTTLLAGEFTINGEKFDFHIHSLDTRPGELVVKISKDDAFVRLRGIDADAPLKDLPDILKYGVKKGKQLGIF